MKYTKIIIFIIIIQFNNLNTIIMTVILILIYYIIIIIDYITSDKDIAKIINAIHRVIPSCLGRAFNVK